MVYVYILKLSNGKHYTGMTKHLLRRLQEHTEGKSISTKHNLPVDLIYCTELKDSITARLLEKKIKSRGAERFLLDRKYKDNLPYENTMNTQSVLPQKSIGKNEQE